MFIIKKIYIKYFKDLIIYILILILNLLKKIKLFN